MQLPPQRQEGTLIQRYKRFLADIQLPDATTLTAHCPNSGSMKGCSTPGSKVIISHSDNPKRKYPWTLEMVQEQGVWIGVNTSLTNKLVREALENGTINDFGHSLDITAEVKVSDKSRLDFHIQTRQHSAFLEVKNCSLAEDGIALFPDAVTARGTKHLEELMHLQQQGYDAAVLFCVQRADAHVFSPAAAIDPTYSQKLKEAAKNGVMVLAYQAEVTPSEVRITRKIPVKI